MIKYFSVIISLLVLATCTTIVDNHDALIGFAKEKHDFRKVLYKKQAEYTFDFSNKGKTMLVIQDVMTSCGCTVPEWTKKPIQPGRKGIVKIKYDADSPGVLQWTRFPGLLGNSGGSAIHGRKGERLIKNQVIKE